MAILAADGFTTTVETGVFKYSNGGILHTISLTNGEKAVVLAKMQSQDGGLDAFVFETIGERSFIFWDESSRIELTINEDGEIYFSTSDEAGSPALKQQGFHHSALKVASIASQSANNCHPGQMAGEFRQCLDRNYKTARESLCLGSLGTGLIACVTPPFVGCTAIFASTMALCGIPIGYCLWEMIDNPPTYTYTKPVEIETYRYCQGDMLKSESLYRVHVDCSDDRNPQPEDITVFLTSNEAKDFTCRDCSGQTTTGTIPSSGEVSVTECKYGCQIVGNGNDRCLKSGETPEDSPVTGAFIPAGTYTGTTTLPDLFDQGEFADKYKGTDLENIIIITVAEDGTVSGHLHWRRIGLPYAGDSCEHKINIDYEGTLYGTLYDVSGEVTISLVGVFTTMTMGDPQYCSTPAYDIETEDELAVTIIIRGDTMTGEVPGVFSFTAR
jgi:hypothetical protein